MTLNFCPPASVPKCWGSRCVLPYPVYTVMESEPFMHARQINTLPAEPPPQAYKPVLKPPGWGIYNPGRGKKKKECKKSGFPKWQILQLLGVPRKVSRNISFERLTAWVWWVIFFGLSQILSFKKKKGSYVHFSVLPRSCASCIYIFNTSFVTVVFVSPGVFIFYCLLGGS